MTTHDQVDRTTFRPNLRTLGDRLGIQALYLDQTGEKLRLTSDATREAVLGAMGIDASTEERAAEALKALRATQRRQWIAPVRVVRQRSRSLSTVMVRVPRTHAHDVRWTLVLRTEEGMDAQWSGTTHGGRSRKLRLE